MLKAKNVKIEYNETTGHWAIQYQGPSETYTCTEYGIAPGAPIRTVYIRAGVAVLAANNLVVPPMDECEITVRREG